MCSANRTANRSTTRSLDDPAVQDARPKRRELGKGFTSLGRRRRTRSGHLRRLLVRHRHPGRKRRGGRLPRHPGLLDADQMRALLHRRQDEQLQKRAASGQAAPPARRVPCTVSSASCAANSTPWSRWPITAPASRTDGSTTNCAGAAEGRRSPPRPATSSRSALIAVRQLNSEQSSEWLNRRRVRRTTASAGAPNTANRCFSIAARAAVS